MTFESLVADELFQEKMHQAKDITEIILLFSEAGVEITEKDLMRKILPEDQELSEEALEDVAGGGAAVNWIRSKLRGGKGSFGSGGKMGGR